MIPMGIRAAKVKTARTGTSLQTSASAMQQMQTGMGASQLSSARKSASGKYALRLESVCLGLLHKRFLPPHPNS